jgi:hypothetical protein
MKSAGNNSFTQKHALVLFLTPTPAALPARCLQCVHLARGCAPVLLRRRVSRCSVAAIRAERQILDLGDCDPPSRFHRLTRSIPFPLQRNTYVSQNCHGVEREILYGKAVLVHTRRFLLRELPVLFAKGLTNSRSDQLREWLRPYVK